MELSGFGASLVGRSLFVHASPGDAWIPWEFISGTQYAGKILITGTSTTIHRVEAENLWTVIYRPSTTKDWSCLATIITGLGHSVLLTFDSSCPKPPEAFLRFLDSTVTGGRIVLTRIWIGIGIELPLVPDAIFFPVLDANTQGEAYDLMCHLPGRGSHGPWKKLNDANWRSYCNALHNGELGFVLSDVEESEWTLAWHKISDSPVQQDLRAQGLAWMKTGLLMLEKMS